MDNNPSPHLSVCAGPECDLAIYCKGYCKAHYYQARDGRVRPLHMTCDYLGCEARYRIRSGVQSPRCPAHRKTCGVVIDGVVCGRISNRPTCPKHFHRLNNYGDPGPAEGRLRRRVYSQPKWRKNSQGYVYRAVTVNGERVHQLQHREVMAQALGRPLLAEENVHHINGVRDDNRPENLELWTTSQPSGQRVADKVAWAREILALYADLVV